MTVWMAIPPEVHSSLLSAGPGAGSLLAAASSWEALRTEFAAVAAELSTLLAMVQGNGWDGTAAARYAAAHAPFLDWLMRSSAKSAGAAAQHAVAAASYTAALSAMPTLTELAANHAVHGVLVATNFFGLNTIPIALNESDYARMWVQAATTMTVYQAFSSSAVTSVAATDAAPPIGTAEPAKFPPTDPIEQALAWSEHFSSMYRVLKGLVTNPLGTVAQIITDFATNPTLALTTWLPLVYVFAYTATFALLGSPLYTVLAAPGFAAIPLALGLSALCALPGAVAEASAEAPGVVSDGVVTGITVTATTGTTPASGPAPLAHPPTTGITSGPTAFTPPAELAYLVGPGPGPGPALGPTLRDKASASAPGSQVAVRSAAAATGAAKGRRRRQDDLNSRGYRDEFLTSDAGAPVGHSGAGAGSLGFTGCATISGIDTAGGLKTLAGNTFSDAPTVPMAPATWDGESRRT